MHCRRFSSLSFAVLAVVLVSCGSPQGPSAPSSALRTGQSSGLAAAYVPAAQSCPAMTGPAVVQGPVVGSPKHVSGYLVCGSFTAQVGRSSFSCPLPAGAVGPYRLLVYNGNPDGSARAESATIRVNGRAVLDEDDFDEKVSAATAQVELAPANTIEVRIEERRALLRVQIVDEGQTCSILRPSFVSEANSPLAASFSSTNAFPIPELQLFNGVPAGMRKVEKGSISLNGATILSRRQFHEKMSAFLASVPVSATNKLVAIAGEGTGKGDQERRPEKVRRQYSVQVVDRDKTPPSFSIASPGDGSYTNRPQLSVSGPIDDPSAQVSIGNVLGAIASGSYSAQAALGECWNTVTVQAADVCGNSSEASVRVGLDTVPPVLAIVGPRERPGDEPAAAAGDFALLGQLFRRRSGLCPPAARRHRHHCGPGDRRR